MSRNQLSRIMSNVILTESIHIEDIGDTILSEYQKLNDKCDTIINKIKDRKEKKNKK